MLKFIQDGFGRSPLGTRTGPTVRVMVPPSPFDHWVHHGSSSSKGTKIRYSFRPVPRESLGTAFLRNPCLVQHYHSRESGTLFIDQARLQTRQVASGGPGRTAVHRSGRRRLARTAITALVAVTCLGAAACGSSTSSTSPSSSTSSSSSSSSVPAASASSAGAGSAEAATSASNAQGSDGVGAAKAALVPFTGHPSPFPVDVPLSKAIAPGTTIAYLQCGTPICALVAQLIEPAVKALGASLKVVNAGSTAASAQAAASTVLSLKPAAVLISGVNPQTYSGGLKELAAAGIKVLSISVPGDVKQYGVDFNYVGLNALQLGGRLLADWVIAHKGSNADVVFYGVPELTFTPFMEDAFKGEMAKNCPSCKLRFSSIGIATLGTTGTSTIVTDLQSNPSTTVAVFGTGDAATGLPAAMKAAGIPSSLTTVIWNPAPTQIQYIKDGSISAGLATDIAVQIWTLVDVTARLINGEQPTQGEVEGVGPFQFLQKADITFDPSHGFAGYPDFAQRFAKLWKPAP